MSDKEIKPILLPMIGRVMTVTIASQPVGIQAMAAPRGPLTYSIETGESFKEDNFTIEWYWAKVIIELGVYRLTFGHDEKHDDVHQWCVETFGPEKQPEHDSKWICINSNQFCFAQETDRTLFALRWR